MRFLHGTFLSSGKPRGRPLDSDLVGKTSQCVAPNLDPRGIGAKKDKATVLRGLGQLKEEGNLLPLSLSPTLISEYVLWEKNNGRISLPTHTFGMGDVKEKISNVEDIPVEVSPALSLLSGVDQYWKYQLLV